METVSERKLTRAAEGFCWAARRAFDRGLQASTGGNISIRLGEDRFLTKPTGIGLIDCRPSGLVMVDAAGSALEGFSQPTKEIKVHIALFGVRPDVNAIVHYHAPFTTAYAVREQPLPLPTVHAQRIFKKIPLVPEYPEGSPDLEAAVATASKDETVSGVLMASHGLICFGQTIQKAQYKAELMEESAHIGWLAQQIT